jgi:hypothetical protein
MALPRNSTLELSLYILGRCLFKGIGTTGCDQRESYRAKDRHGFHLLTLEMKQSIARRSKR